MADDLGALRDIHGLDALPWWPIALGWWILLGIGLLLLTAGIGLAWWIGWLRRDWRRDARRHLRKLSAQVNQLSPKEVASQLSGLMRRIAMARHGRVACASITGNAWLEWLGSQDPAGFSWPKHGRVLIELPYAPPRDQVGRNDTDPDQLKVLLEAAFSWLEVKDLRSFVADRPSV
ncbi:DUF4381 domain-containing protein [Gammaproteobacteria bacterium]